MEYGTAELCSLLGNRTRVQLLRILQDRPQKPDREEPERVGVSVTALAEECGVTVSAMSQHLAKLRPAGLVVYDRVKHMAFYRLNEGLPSLVTSALAYDAGRES